MNKDEEEFRKLRDEGVAPEVAKVIFATQWDDAIDFYRAVAQSAGMTPEQWDDLLMADREILSRMVPLPKNMTVESARPFVELSDMLTLARVARFCFEHVDKIGGPL